jgi:hypothetical protein
VRIQVWAIEQAERAIDLRGCGRNPNLGAGFIRGTVYSEVSLGICSGTTWFREIPLFWSKNIAVTTRMQSLPKFLPTVNFGP